jgi:hypothetical protein
MNALVSFGGCASYKLGLIGFVFFGSAGQFIIIISLHKGCCAYQDLGKLGLFILNHLFSSPAGTGWQPQSRRLWGWPGQFPA